MAILLKTALVRVSSIQIMQVRVQNKGKSVWKSRYDGDVSPDYGRSSPWHRYNTAPGRPGHRHMPPASPAFRCYYVGIGYIVCLAQLYMRGLGYKCPTRTRLHILSKHNTTTSPTVTYLVHYIRHNSNKLHLGEYSPPPWIRQCVKLVHWTWAYPMSTAATPKIPCDSTCNL